MGFILCHFTPLVIDSLDRRQTDTHTRTHTRTHTNKHTFSHIEVVYKSNFKKSDVPGLTTCGKVGPSVAISGMPHVH